MKVLFFIRSFFGGGAEKVLLDYVKGLDKKKYDITIMVRSPHGILKDQFLDLRHQGIHIRWCFDHLKPGKNLFEKVKNTLLLRLGDWSTYRCPRLFYKLAIHEKYDVEIAFMHDEAASIIASSSNKHSKKLLWVHTDLRRLSSFKQYFISRKRQGAYYKKFDKCICVSQIVADSISELFGITENVHVLHNPVDQDRILTLSLNPSPLPVHTPPIVCAVGRLSWEKNFSMLISTHANLICKGIMHQLCIVGEGPERNALERQIKQLGVENSVILAGFQSNPYPYLKKAYVSVCSSVYEGLHIASQESLVLGVPVVSCCAVTAEVFGDYNCGIITEPDQTSFEAGLEKMLTDSTFRSKCAQQATLRGQELGLETAILAVEKLLEIKNGEKNHHS